MVSAVQFRAKDKSGKWLYGSYFPEDLLITNIENGIGSKPIVYAHQIEKHTLCRGSGLFDSNKQEIFSGDLVHITLHSGRKECYLVWYNEEDHEFDAIMWDDIFKHDRKFIRYGSDLLAGYPVNFQQNENIWKDFVLLVDTDPYQDMKYVKIIENAVDNPKILLEERD